MPTLTATDALQLLDQWGNLPDADRARLRPQLREFRDNDGSEAIRQHLDDRAAPLANLEKYYLDGYDTYLDSLPAPARDQRRQVDALLGDQPDDRDRAANTALISALTGQPPARVSVAYESLIPGAYARLTGTAGPGDHASFTSAAKKHFAEIRRDKELISRAGDFAARAALTSDTWAPAYAAWQASLPGWDKVDKTKEPLYRKSFVEAFADVSTQVDYARPAVRQVLSQLRERYGVTDGEAEEISLADVSNIIHTYAGDDPRTRRLLIAATAALAEEQGITQDGRKTVRQNLGESVARGAESVIAGAGRFLGRQIASAGAATANAIGAGELGEALGGTAATIEIATELRRVADSSVDPVAPLLDGWRGTVERGLYMAGRSVPYTATVMLGPGGMATTTLGLADQNASHLRNQGASAGIADAVGLAAAVPEMLLERLQGKLATGATFNLLQKSARKFGLRGATGIGGRTAAEFLTEKAQDLVLPTVQQLGRAISSDVPGVDWRSTVAQWTDLEANAELLVSVVPLSLIGAGGATYREFKSGHSILKDRHALDLLGIPQTTIDAIADAPTPEDAQRILQEAYPVRDTASTADRARDYAAAARRSAAALRQLEGRAAIPRIHPEADGEGYTITDPETGDTYHTLTAGDAHTLRSQILAARSADTAADPEIAELAAYFQDRESDLTAETSPNPKSLADAVAQGARTAESAYQTIALEEQASGVSFGDGPDLSSVRILGENIGEFRDNVYHSTMRLYRGASVLTVVHEKAETDARKWDATGTVTFAQLRALIAAHDPDLIKGDTAEATIEAWSTLVQSAAIERSKDDFQPTKGFRGTLARLIRGYKEFFRHVLRGARALRQARAAGTLDADLDLLLQQSLNIGEEATYQADTDTAASELTGTPTFSIAPRSGMHLSAARDFVGLEITAEDVAELTRYGVRVKMGQNLLKGDVIWANGFVRTVKKVVEDPVSPAIIIEFEEGDRITLFSYGRSSKMLLLPTADGVPSFAARSYVESIFGKGSKLQGTFSIAPQAIQRRLEAALTPALAAPEARREAYQRARQTLAVEAERWAAAATGRKTKAAIAKEARHYEEAIYQQFLDDNPTVLAHLESAAILGDIMQQPVAGYLLGEIGKLESRSRAADRDSNSLSFYDDAPYLPSYFYGGRTSPTDAARQLYNEAGLLNSDDVGEMWLRLSAEISSVSLAREKYAEAKEIDLKARRHAKERAKAWKEAQLRDQNRIDRRSLARSLATLDTILAAFPPEVRARVGGYSSLATFDSDEARLRYLEGRIVQLDRQLERYLQGEAIADIAILLEKARSKIKDSDRIKRSRLGPEADRQLDLIMQSIALDPEQADARTAELEASIAAAEDDKANAAAVELYTIHNLFSNLADRSAAELESAHTHLADIVLKGRSITKALLEEKQQRRAEWRMQAQGELPTPAPAHGHPTGQRQRDTQEDRDKSRIGRIRDYLREHLSFGQLLDSLYQVGDVRTGISRLFQDRVRRATHAKTDAILQHRRRYRQALTDIFGTASTLKQNRALYKLQKRNETSIEFYEGRTIKRERIHEDAAGRIILGTLSDKRFRANTQEFLSLEAELQKNRNLTGPFKKEFLEVDRIVHPGTPTRQKLSQLEMVYYTMLARQDGYAPVLHAHGIDGAALDAMEEALTPEARGIRNYLKAEYAGGYNRLNPVYRDLYGTDMPKVDNYAPAHFEHAGGDTELDLLNTGIAAGGMGAGFVKSRRTHRAEPIKTDALAAYWAHINQVEHFIHLTPVVNDLRAVFGHTDTKKAIKASAGGAASNRLIKNIEVIANDGRSEAQLAVAVHRSLQRTQTALAHIGLGFKLGTLMKQASAALGSALEMKPGDIARALPRALVGPDSFTKIFRSSTIRRRIESGYSPEVRAALRGSHIAPSTILHLLDKGLLPIAWVDAAFTSFSGALAFNHHLRKALAAGIPPADAREFALDQLDDVVARTAQPAETPDRSLAEINATGAGKLLFMFRSEPRQKFAISYMAAELMLKGRISKAEGTRRLFVAWVLMPMVTQTMSNLYLDAFTDLEDEDIWEPEDYAIAAVLGPLSGIFIYGGLIQGIAQASTGGRIYSEGNPLIESAANLFDALRWSKKDEGPLPWMQDNYKDGARLAHLYLRALAQIIGGRAAAAGPLSSLWKQVEGLYKNVTTPDEPAPRTPRR